MHYSRAVQVYQILLLRLCLAISPRPTPRLILLIAFRRRVDADRLTGSSLRQL